MNATHTPGPWGGLGVRTDPIKDTGRGEYATGVFSPLPFPEFLPYIATARGRTREEADANARLIAAAPALLAALLEVKRLRDLWRSQDDAVSIDSIAYMDGLDRINVDAVIAGAKGS